MKTPRTRLPSLGEMLDLIAERPGAPTSTPTPPGGSAAAAGRKDPPRPAAGKEKRAPDNGSAPASRPPDQRGATAGERGAFKSFAGLRLGRRPGAPGDAAQLWDRPGSIVAETTSMWEDPPGPVPAQPARRSREDSPDAQAKPPRGRGSGRDAAAPAPRAPAQRETALPMLRPPAQAVVYDHEDVSPATEHSGEDETAGSDWSSALEALTGQTQPVLRNQPGAPSRLRPQPVEQAAVAAAPAQPVARRDKDSRSAPLMRQRPVERESRPASRELAVEEVMAPRGNGMSMAQKLMVFAGVIGGGLLVGWWLLAGTGVKAAKVVRGTAVQIVYATGPVESETWARLTPLVRGRIVERCRCEGAPVKAGQRLARLDDREGQAVLKDLRAQESYLSMEFERQSQLMEKGSTTAQAYQKTQIELDRIRAQVAAQIERLRYYELQAPMDGVVLKEDGEVGDMVDPGNILYQVGQPKPLWVVGEVNEEDVPRVTPGQKALLRSDAFPGRILDGFVKQITPAGDPVAKTFRVRIGLPDDTPLHIGMTAEINIITGEKADVLLVPATSVYDNSVLVVTDGRPELRKVGIGIRGSSNFEITSGVREGELVAVEPSAEIRDMSRVRILSIETPGR